MEIAVPAAAMAETAAQPGADGPASEWDAFGGESHNQPQETPVIDSPSISADWPASEEAGTDGLSVARHHGQEFVGARRRRPSWIRRLLRLPAADRAPGESYVSLPTACAAMGALVLALVIWRVDVVRLLPQTASFYNMVGLEVNLRGLTFKDVRITSETVQGKPVLVIEGAIVGEARKPVELPRLRFSVRDAQGAEIYAWNAILEQAVLKPGEKTWFKSRLASPPPEGRNIDVRFFNKRDLAGGST